MALKNNTWKLNQRYDQSVAGNADYDTSAYSLWAWGYAPSGNLGLNEVGIVRRASPTQILGDWGNSMLGGGEHCVFALKQF